MPNQTLYDNFSQVRQYIDQEKPDLTSYVTKTELANASYVTSSDLPIIDENIVPKENNTYILGDSTHLYAYTYTQNLLLENNTGLSKSVSSRLDFNLNGDNKFYIGSGGFFPVGSKQLGSNGSKFSATYTEKLYFNSGNEFYNDNAYQIVLKLNNSDKYVFRTEYIRPISNNGASLGLSNFKFSTTYTANFYADTAYLQDTSYTKSIVPTENTAYTLGDADHLYAASYTKSTYFTNNTKIVGSGSDINFYTGGLSRIKINNNILRPDRTGVDLGTSSNKWGATYTYNLYADTIHNFIWTGTSAEYAALSDYTTYQIYMIKKS